MQEDAGRKTEQAYWDTAWRAPVKKRLPSMLNVGVLNASRLLKKYVKPGCRYLEIGCAPGKMLSWVASVLKADAAGLDYSESGIAQCHALFDALGLEIRLHHADVFKHHILPASFDVVASFGVIEHFDDARPVVQKHLDLVKPGGVALIVVPNYGGIYGLLQRWCDAPNLELHNLKIMSPTALRALVDSPDVDRVHAYPFGVLSPWLVSFERQLPRSLAGVLSLGFNIAGLLQPLPIRSLAPLLVLEVRKGSMA